jgi:hypothetical protein
VHLGHISRQRRAAPDRVRIVVDDTGHLDEFAGS